MSEATSIQVGKPHRPFGVKLINLIGRVAKALGLPLVRLDEDRLLRKAIKQAGSSDFGDDDFREGLRRFLASAESEAELIEKPVEQRRPLAHRSGARVPGSATQKAPGGYAGPPEIDA